MSTYMCIYPGRCVQRTDQYWNGWWGYRLHLSVLAEARIKFRDVVNVAIIGGHTLADF